MTVCIAAMNADIGTGVGVIVTVNDMLLSDNSSAVETADEKTARLVGHPLDTWSPWFCLYAGDPTVFRELTAHIRTALTSIPIDSLSSGHVLTAVQNAYDAVINRRIEREVLAQQYGLNFAQFIAMGQARHKGALVDVIKQQIADARREIVDDMLYRNITELLICGFDSDAEPNIFSSDGIGRCVLRNGYGFHAIGVGAPAATAWLLANPSFCHGVDGVSELVHRMCEAKFLAESPFVGKDTLINTWFSNGAGATLFLFEQERNAQIIRKAWKQHTERKGPPSSVAAIDKLFREWTKRTGEALPDWKS
jgi:hypothetical protein